MAETKYKLDLSPRLGIKPDEFMQVWNSSELCASTATADTEQSRGFPDAQTLNHILVILENVSAGVMSNVIYDRIKYLLRTHRIRIESKPDPTEEGSTLLAVVSDESVGTP